MRKLEAYEAFSTADDAWQAEIVRLFGRPDAGDVRYKKAGRGESGSELRRLHDARMAAMFTWEGSGR